MKAISFKTLVFFALAANVTLFSCSKKSDPTPTANNGSNGANTNSIKLASVTSDTLWTASGDSGTRTFLNGTDALVYTAAQVATNKSGSTIVLGFNYNTDTTYGASITNADTYPVDYSWFASATVTYFKTVSLSSASLDTLSQASLEGLYKNSTATAVSAVYKVKEGQVIAFQNQTSMKYGVLIVNKIVNNMPNPYTTYLAYSLKIEE